MDFSAKRFVLAAGLSGMLALSVVGCGGSSSSSSSTESSTSVSVTDDSKNTESTSTSSSDTGKVEDPSEYTYYEIEALGFRCDLPDGYKFDAIDLDIDKEGEAVQAFQYSNDDGSNMNLQVTKLDEDLDVESDEYLNECLDEAEKALDEIGATVNSKETGTMRLSNGTTLPAINLTYTLSGIDLMVTQGYVVKDGYLLTITGTARSEDVVVVLFDSLTF